jgi:N-acyl homoserine lactone hydrolase
MRLYAFSCGVLESQKHLFTSGRGVGEPFTVPVPFYLIDHPKGLVLFDTGNALAVAQDSESHWGSVVESYRPRMNEEDFVVNQLQAMGYAPEDIAYVVLSHLHLDHAGGIGYFPNARYVVQRDELHFAYVPEFYQKAAYIRKDFDRPVDWLILEGWHDDGFDLFGDARIRIWFSPGHTPGHQSLRLNLQESGLIILTGDSCYTLENLEEDVLPGVVWSPSETIRSINRLREERRRFGAKIFTGHDPEAWKEIKKAPSSYK